MSVTSAAHPAGRGLARRWGALALLLLATSVCTPLPHLGSDSTGHDNAPQTPPTDWAAADASGLPDDGARIEDAGPGESGPGEAAPVDSGPRDGGPLLACPPGNVTNFAPEWKPPRRLHTSACSAAGADAVVACLFDPSADLATCTSYLKSSEGLLCSQCIVPYDVDAGYGPIVAHGAGYPVLNVGGCIANISADVTAAGCGARVFASSGCQQVACAGCTAGLADYRSCQIAAMSGVCNAYSTASSCADGLTAPDAAAAICVTGSSTFIDTARALARLFCVP